MAFLNRIELIGNLGKDMEIRHTPTNKQYASGTIAVNERWTSTSDDGQTKTQNVRTDWFNLQAWAGLAKILGNYGKKGRLVYLEGRLRTDKYTDANGQDAWFTYVLVDSVQFLDKRPDQASEPEGAVVAEPELAL